MAYYSDSKCLTIPNNVVIDNSNNCQGSNEFYGPYQLYGKAAYMCDVPNGPNSPPSVYSPSSSSIDWPSMSGMWPSVNNWPSYDNNMSPSLRNDNLVLVIERFNTMTCALGSMTSIDIIPLNMCLPHNQEEFIKFQVYPDQKKFESQLFANEGDCNANTVKSGVDEVVQTVDFKNPMGCSPSHLNPNEGIRVRIVTDLPAIPPGFIAEM